MRSPVAWFRITRHANGTESHSLHFTAKGEDEILPGDNVITLPLQFIPSETKWIEELRKEIMLNSKATHNFTFTRDEVMQLLGINQCGSTPSLE